MQLTWNTPSLMSSGIVRSNPIVSLNSDVSRNCICASRLDHPINATNMTPVFPSSPRTGTSSSTLHPELTPLNSGQVFNAFWVNSSKRAAAVALDAGVMSAGNQAERTSVTGAWVLSRTGVRGWVTVTCLMKPWEKSRYGMMVLVILSWVLYEHQFQSDDILISVD